MNEFPVRKKVRLPNYDYTQCSVYFLTICAAGRQPIFWSECVYNGEIPLSYIGKSALQGILQIPERYEAVQIVKHCIMPDHIHLLLSIDADSSGRPMVAPTVSRVVQQFKGVVSKAVGRSIWQRSFYDHVIRNRADFEACWQYIENNPLKYEVKSCL